MANVGGVADLARLAVADDVDADVGLLLHGVVNAALYGLFEYERVDRFVPILSEQQVQDFARSGEASDMCRQDPVDA